MSLQVPCESGALALTSQFLRRLPDNKALLRDSSQHGIAEGFLTTWHCCGIPHSRSGLTGELIFYTTTCSRIPRIRRGSSALISSTSPRNSCWTFSGFNHGVLQVYPPWRWYEKQDGIRMVQRREAVSEFYNILLEKPKVRKRRSQGSRGDEA